MLIQTDKILFTINDRFLWDDSIECDTVVIPITADGFRQAISRIREVYHQDPELITVRWGVAEALLAESNRLFNESEDGQHRGIDSRYSESLDWLGYVGDIDGVPIVASLHMSSNMEGLITTADRPTLIAGENSLWIRGEDHAGD